MDIKKVESVLKKIQALAENPYWTADRRWRIGELAGEGLSALRAEEKALPQRITCAFCSASARNAGATQAAWERFLRDTGWSRLTDGRWSCDGCKPKRVCELCGSEKPEGQSCGCFDNRSE